MNSGSCSQLSSPWKWSIPHQFFRIIFRFHNYRRTKLFFCFTIFSFQVAVLSFTLFPIRLLCLFFLLLLASLIGTLATVCMKKEEEPQPLSGYRRLLIAAYYILNYLCLRMTCRQDTWDPCLKNWDLATNILRCTSRWKERQKMTVTYVS